MDKQSARSHFLGLRRDYFSNSNQVKLRQDLSRQLVPLLESQTGTWATYCSSGFEADPSEAVNQSPWLNWVYPRVHGETLKFYLPNTPDAFEENRWKIKEPIPQHAQAIETDQIDGFLVPGVAFDRQGRRIGLGKGYYDRCLQNSGSVKIGVALKVQISSDALPAESHDVSMDFVATDQSVLKTSSRNLERENQ